jgi:ribose 5-phosphate isomerase A
MLRSLSIPCRSAIKTTTSTLSSPWQIVRPLSHSSTMAAAPLQLNALQGVEAAKRAAAYAAVDNHVKPEHQIIGIGSGSTVPYVVERIVQQGQKVNSNRWFVPTGFQSKELIVKSGLKLGDVDSFPEIDVTIDGADEVDSNLNAIKGGGACQLREKVLAEAAKTFIIVADFRKNSEILGTGWKQGVPIEVAEFAWSKVQRQLVKLGSTNAALRMGKAKAGPVVTDNGNFVIDAQFDEKFMNQPDELLKTIKLLTGVIEVGLFTNMCQAAYFGNDDGTITAKQVGGKVQNGITFDVSRNPIVS